MIKYTLKCTDGHVFDSWFQSASAFDTLANAGHLSCAVCGSAQVSKQLMAPRVSGTKKTNAEEPTLPAETPELTPLSQPASEIEAAMAKLKAHVEKTSTYVGGDFAKQARAMHDGVQPETPIYGEAKPAEAKALIEDGIPVAPLPFRPTTKTN